MSSRVVELFLFDIFVAIIKIEIVISKFDSAEELLHDFVSWDSVMREFSIVGEATNMCIKENLVDSKYRVIVDFRNKIIHHYFGIDAEAVWNISNNELQDFKKYIIQKIEEIEDKNLQKELVLSFIDDNKNYKSVVKSFQQLQISSMEKIWKNIEDEAWDKL
jgi:uncharacterized protein with HEPN domain